jgi:hypothetical protein
MVGLTNVDNTSDAINQYLHNKAALNLKANLASPTFYWYSKWYNKSNG